MPRRLQPERPAADAGKRSRDAEHAAAAGDLRVHFTDYKKVDGVLLPHTITQGTNGTVNEEFTIEKSLNAPLKPEQFVRFIAAPRRATPGRRAPSLPAVRLLLFGRCAFSRGNARHHRQAVRLVRVIRQGLVFVCALVVWAAAPLRAADEPTPAAAATGDLKVAVVDQTGAALIIASVTLVDATGAEKMAKVDDHGVATFAGIAPGEYTLKAGGVASVLRRQVHGQKGANQVSLKRRWPG